MATPFTEANEVDYEDLAREVDFLVRCGVHGMVWPQLASEYPRLSKQERMRGMEVLAKAAQSKRPALVLGVQGPNVAAAMEYLKHAEQLGCDALIAIPPSEAKSPDDYHHYYAMLAGATSKPLFIQTTGGAREITPSVEMLAKLAREFPNLGHVKEEVQPVIERMQELARHRPAVRSLFSGGGGRGMIYEMRLGMDGTMPGAPYSDVYVAVWDAWQSGKKEKAREIFAALQLMLNVEQFVPRARMYIMKKRGVFKTTVSRYPKSVMGQAAIEEVEFHYAALKPYLRT